jgi:hypothetical protein
VVHRSAGNKAPGRDAICLEFFKVNWDTIKDDTLALFTRCIWTVKYWNNRSMG